MFDLCKRDVSSIINYYVSFKSVGGDLIVHRKYPTDTADVYTQRITEFGFSCCTQRSTAEDFVIVFTDAKGTLEFVFCGRHKSDVIVCVSSNLPWCHYFHSLVQMIWRDDLYNDASWPQLQTVLNYLLDTGPPALRVNSFVCPDPFVGSRWPKMEIPTPVSPHNVKYVMEYYNALALDVWVHIFVSLLLERSILFHSKRLSRLTACVLASVSLLYPLNWVHSFYPLLPRNVLQVLECPVPFVAGIHSCNLEAAQDHLNDGTCLVNLDAGSVHMFQATCRQQDVSLHMDCSTPKAVYAFLSQQLNEVEHGANLAMSPQHSKKKDRAGRYEDWKKVDGEVCRFFDHLTKPFFNLIVNLLGCYTECIVDQLDASEVDIDALVSCQGCPGLEQFLRLLCESQHVRLFLDTRAKERPDPETDPFEASAMRLQPSAGGRRVTSLSVRQQSMRHSVAALTSPAPIYQRKVNNRSLLVGKTIRPTASINFGSAQWLRCKQLRNPGEPCPWNAKAGSGSIFGGPLSPSSLAFRLHSRRGSGQNRRVPKDAPNSLVGVTPTLLQKDIQGSRPVRPSHLTVRPEKPSFPRSLNEVIDDSSEAVTETLPTTAVWSEEASSSEVTLDGLEWLKKRASTLSYTAGVSSSKPKPPPRPPPPRSLQSISNHLATANGFPPTAEGKPGTSPPVLSTVQQVAVARRTDPEVNSLAEFPLSRGRQLTSPSHGQHSQFSTTRGRPRPPPPPCVSYRSRGISQRLSSTKSMSYVNTINSSPLVSVVNGELEIVTASDSQAALPVTVHASTVVNACQDVGMVGTEEIAPHRASPLLTSETQLNETSRPSASLTRAGDFSTCDQEVVLTPRIPPRSRKAVDASVGRPKSLPSLVSAAAKTSRSLDGDNASACSTLDIPVVRLRPRIPRNSATLGGGRSASLTTPRDIRCHVRRRYSRPCPSPGVQPEGRAPLAPRETHSDGESSEDNFNS